MRTNFSWNQYTLCEVPYFEKLYIHTDRAEVIALYMANNKFYMKLKAGTNLLCLCHLWSRGKIMSAFCQPHWHGNRHVWDLIIQRDLKVVIHKTTQPATVCVVSLTTETSSLQYLSRAAILQAYNFSTSNKQLRYTPRPLRSVLKVHKLITYVAIQYFAGFKDNRMRHVGERNHGPRFRKEAFIECCTCERKKNPDFARLQRYSQFQDLPCC
jgi:hypothetical protein